MASPRPIGTFRVHRQLVQAGGACQIPHASRAILSDAGQAVARKEGNPVRATAVTCQRVRHLATSHVQNWDGVVDCSHSQQLALRAQAHCHRGLIQLHIPPLDAGWNAVLFGKLHELIVIVLHLRHFDAM